TSTPNTISNCEHLHGKLGIFITQQRYIFRQNNSSKKGLSPPTLEERETPSLECESSQGQAANSAGKRRRSQLYQFRSDDQSWLCNFDLNGDCHEPGSKSFSIIS
ncbi:unnamed protein product, partial [Ilex paraguariensis]